MWLKIFFIFLISIADSRRDSLNILVYSTIFAPSHMNFMAHLADTLTEAGHNVTVLAPVSFEPLRGLLGLKITKNVIYVEQDDVMKKNMKPIDDNMKRFWTDKNTAVKNAKNFEWLTELMVETCALVLRDKKLFEILKHSKFDVAISEPLAVCPLGLFEKLGIDKTILASSTVQYEYLFEHIGEPYDMSYVPAMFSDTTDVMDISQRYSNLIFSKEIEKLMRASFDKEMKLYKKHLDSNIPHWSELLNSASLYFTNSNPYIDFPRPIIQKTVAIGGISVDMERIKSQKLDDQWNQILNQRSRNMLISFGSMIQSAEMPLEWRSNILSVIRTMPNVTFIWKYESDDLLWAHGANNIYFSKWVPQTALLADPRVNAFLTHGGLGSINEMAHCGKPAVMIPIFCDQFRNSNMLARHNTGIVVKKENLHKFKIVQQSIHRVLNEKSFKMNAEKLAEILQNQPISPKEFVVKYTEFVAKFGPFPNMIPSSKNLNFFERNFIDAYTILFLGYFLFFLISFLFLRYFIQHILTKKIQK